MSSVFRRMAFACLTSVGLTYSRQSSVPKIHDLFRKLWPMNVEMHLKKCGDYLIPENIGSVDVLFSPGVGFNSDFELHFADQGVPCYMADASVDAPSVQHENFHFLKRYIGPKSDGEFISLEDWINANYTEGQNAILQMDIEGAEYQSIMALPHETLRRFKMIVMEVHYLNFLASQEGLALGNTFFNYLLKYFTVVHLHVNNYLRPVRFKGLNFPQDIEITLIRSDLVRSVKPVDVLPHPLDIKNNPKKSDHVFHQYFKDGVIAKY
jgi:hypothetical protein